MKRRETKWTQSCAHARAHIDATKQRESLSRSTGSKTKLAFEEQEKLEAASKVAELESALETARNAAAALDDAAEAGARGARSAFSSGSSQRGLAFGRLSHREMASVRGPTFEGLPSLVDVHLAARERGISGTYL